MAHAATSNGYVHAKSFLPATNLTEPLHTIKNNHFTSFILNRAVLLDSVSLAGIFTVNPSSNIANSSQ